jgi:ABC-type nitrate/sulfonate/bicarbonate transport system permease component
MSDHEHGVGVASNLESGELKQWLGGKTATQLAGLLGIALIWEILFRARITSELLFPSIIDVIAQFWLSAAELFMRVGVTFSYIGYAMAIALFLSFFLSVISVMPWPLPCF